MPGPPIPLEPLFFARRLHDKVWGGARLARRLGLEGRDRLGESWELSDYPEQETSVRGGTCDGRSMRELMAAHADVLLGRSRPDPDGRFPLLVKLLEARKDLSVQIHPGDGPGSPTGIGKTEAWYVLEADPDASVLCGLRPGTTRAEFEADAGDARVVDRLHSVPVRSGDCVFVPAGQAHAIRGGIVLVEVQQTSDVTFRMYDWDRDDGRELHLPQALAAVDYSLPPGAVVRAPEPLPNGALQAAPLVGCDYFTLESLLVHEPAERATGGRARVYVVLEGEGEVRCEVGSARRFSTCDVFLIPGGARSARFQPEAGSCRLLEAVAL